MIAKMLFSGSFEHHVRFDTKAKAFDRGGHVLVCECVQDGVLCGVICAGKGDVKPVLELVLMWSRFWSSSAGRFEFGEVMWSSFRSVFGVI